MNLIVYISNNKKSDAISNTIAEFNDNNLDKHVVAQIFWLDDIESKYYDEPIVDRKEITFEIDTKNRGTILNIDPVNYKINQAIEAKYIFTPVLVIYELYKKAKMEQYPLFESNIREYLGTKKTVNGRMQDTLLNKEDCSNFFYYNNGITMIVDDMSAPKSRGGGTYYVKVHNPQIVNGCQTVSTIYETISSLPESSHKERFENTYVMLKVLKIPDSDDELSKNIVKYNNSQNPIDIKTFESISSQYRRIQNEFSKKGVLVCIKQSDKNKFKQKYKKPHDLIDLNQDIYNQFSIENNKKLDNFIIELVKLLQIFTACNDFKGAIQNKKDLLDPETTENEAVINFIKNPDNTINVLFYLFMLNLRAEQENQKSELKFNTLMFVHLFIRFECDGT